MTDEELMVDQDESLQEDVSDGELTDDEQFQATLKETISVEREDLGSLRVKLTVTVPRETLDERFSKEFTDLKRDSTVPGFRKGHAPMRLVEKRFGSDVGEQLKSQFYSSAYLAATDKEGLDTLGEPQFWVKVSEERAGAESVDTEKLLPIVEAIEQLELPKEGPLVFSCELELKPEFELPELKNIPLEKTTASVADEDVESELTRMRMMRGTFEPVEKGGIKKDDMFYADVKMSVDGNVIYVEENTDVAARDVRLKGIPLIDFGDAVVGKKLDETFEFEAPVPDDHETNELRGKTAHFEFKINEIKRLVVPPIDAEFLSVTGFDTEDELREAMRSMLESRLGEVVNRSLHEQLGKYLVDNTEIEIPEGLSQRQTDRSLGRRMIEMYQAGLPEVEVEKRVDELRVSAKDQVAFDLKLFFILEKISEDMDIVLPEEQLNAAIAQIAQRANKRFDRVRDELSKGDGLTTLYLQLRDSKVLDQLLADASVTEVESPKKKAAKKTTAKAKTPKEPAKKAAKTPVKKAAKTPAKKKTS